MTPRDYEAGNFRIYRSKDTTVLEACTLVGLIAHEYL